MFCVATSHPAWANCSCDASRSFIIRIGAARIPLANDLSIWDGREHLDTLKQVCHWNQPLTLQAEEWEWLSLINERALLGDDSALREYRSWMTALKPVLGGPPVFGLSPTWRFPDDAGLRQSLQTLVATWPQDATAAAKMHRYLTGSGEEILQTPIRDWLIQRLYDRTPAQRDQTPVPHEQPADGDDLNAVHKEPAAGIPPGTRTCDVWTAALSDIPGFPCCYLDDPLPVRDRAVNQALYILQRLLGWFRSATVPQAQARLLHAFVLTAEQIQYRPPTLDHPATADDVAEGRAIFTVAGASAAWDVRCVHGIDPAWDWRWTACPGPPVLYQGGERRHRDDEGSVVQVEDVRVGHHWQRWAGLVLPHAILRVPAEQLELAPSDGEMDLGEGWRISWGVKRGTPIDITGVPRFSRDSPPRIVLRVRNGLLKDQALPRRLADPARGWWSRLAPAVYRRSLNGPCDRSEPVDAEHGWRPVRTLLPMSSPIPLVDAQKAPPGTTLPDESVDLSVWFDCAEPGTYALALRPRQPQDPPWVHFQVSGKDAQ